MMSKRQVLRDAKQLFRLCLTDGWPDEKRVLQVVREVAESNRRGSRAVLKEFARQVRLREAERDAVVETAAPLPPELESSLRDGLARRYGPGLTPKFAVEPVLLGGVRIRVGSDVYDGSVRAGLEALEKSF
jgi:F-type H+-transporting ATPase subunit delta